MIENANLEYCWVLGDDDEPIETGFEFLIQVFCKSEVADLMIFNSLGYNRDANQWNITRIKLDKVENEFILRSFIQRAGFWSIPAGFSTLVFKRIQFDVRFMKGLIRDNLRIYSHVTTLLYSFSGKKFKAFATPLVNYSSNSFDDESPSQEVKSEHWEAYGKKVNRFFRDPWTFSFVKQLSILQDKQVYTPKELFMTLDQGHLGSKFFVFESILGFLIDQRIYELQNPSHLKMTNEEIASVCRFLEGGSAKAKQLARKAFEALEKHLQLDDLIILRNEFFVGNSQISNRKVVEICGGSVYETPLGFIWSPFQVDLNRNCGSLSSPSDCVYADTINDLEGRIEIFKNNNPFISRFINSQALNISGLNAVARRSDKIARHIPMWLRKFF